VQPSHRTALEGDAVRVVEEAVEGGVAEGGRPPTTSCQWPTGTTPAGEERSAAGVAVAEDIEEVGSSLVREHVTSASSVGSRIG